MVKTLKLPKEIVENIIENVRKLEAGEKTVELKTVKSGWYKAVLPLDELEFEKGETVYLYHCGKNIWLIVPEKSIKQ